MKTYIKTTQMRRLTLLLLLLFTGMVNAQIVNIPDANFKAKLLEANSSNQIASSATPNSFGTPSSYNSVDINGDGMIQVSEAQQIKVLNIANANIGSIEGILAFINLESLSCFNNQITNLDVNSLTQLKMFDCFNNQLTNLDLSGLTNLNDLSCGGNLIQTININGLSNITVINCSNNNIQNIDVSMLTNLYAFDCSNNNLVTLSIENNPNICLLDCSSNLFLKSLFLKNGTLSCPGEFILNPNPALEYVCTNVSEIQYFQDIFLSSSPANVVVNSYCSFNPGGDYNTITGNLKFDSDNNGCDVNDLAQPNIRVNLNDGTNTGASFTSNTGNYAFFTQTGSFVITPEIENPTFFNFTPTTVTIPFADSNNNTATQDFCISANGVHPDLEVVLAPITPARPGFDATYKLVYKNKGNQTLSGSVNLVFDDAKTDFISANPAVDNLAVNSLTWNYNTLLPFESRSIDIVLNVNSPLETPAVNIGDVLNFTATINPISGDELPDDNTFIYIQTVVGSYDPNDITCLEGNNVAPSEIGENLHYVINFENTGNYPAENVVVKTIVDTTRFDVNSLQLLNTSNPVDARITGNVVEFIFENIQLGGPGGHGHILLKIKSKNTLVAGDAVAKNANIYFDYNAPVDTGMVTTVFQSLSNTVFEKDDSINVSPNPTSGIININSNFNIKKIELYDVQGRVLETQIGETKTIDISEKAKGIYFLKITSEKGSKVEKVIKK
jgi:uncharacterized repeat protein (TIGR01451 family)